MIEAYSITLAALVALQLAPGPNLVAVASTGLGAGRKAALWVTGGIVTGVCLWVLSVSFGLGTLLNTYPFLMTVMKLAGGAYLLWLSLKGLLSMARGTGNKIAPASLTEGYPTRSFTYFWRGFLVVMTNPKAALAWAAMASFLFGSGLTSWQVAAFAPIAASCTATIYGGYGLLFSARSIGELYRRFWRVIEGLFGATFGILGAKLFLDGLKEIKT